MATDLIFPNDETGTYRQNYNYQDGSLTNVAQNYESSLLKLQQNANRYDNKAIRQKLITNTVFSVF